MERCIILYVVVVRKWWNRFVSKNSEMIVVQVGGEMNLEKLRKLAVEPGQTVRMSSLLAFNCSIVLSVAIGPRGAYMDEIGGNTTQRGAM